MYAPRYQLGKLEARVNSSACHILGHSFFPIPTPWVELVPPERQTPSPEQHRPRRAREASLFAEGPDTEAGKTLVLAGGEGAPWTA